MAVEIKKVVLEAEVRWVHITIVWFILTTFVPITSYFFSVTTKIIKFCIANQHDMQLIGIIFLCVAWINMLFFRLALGSLKKRTKLHMVPVEIL